MRTHPAEQDESCLSPPAVSAPELTPRALLTGGLLGLLFAATNVYVGLKVGSVMGSSIAAGIIAYAAWTALGPGGARRWGVLENNINQTTCSAAGAAASAGLVAPIPAYTLLTGKALSWPALMFWTLAVMLVGIVVGALLRRTMVEDEDLPFPSGVAAAEMLKELHERTRESARKLWALLASAAGAGGISAAAGKGWLTPVALPGTSGGLPLSRLGFALVPAPVLVGLGGLIGPRVGVGLLIGAVAAYGVLAPRLVADGRVSATAAVALEALPAGLAPAELTDGRVRYDEQSHRLICNGRLTDEDRAALLAAGGEAGFAQAVGELAERSQRAVPSYRALNRWLVWPGTALMVVGALASTALAWRSVLAGLREATRMLIGSTRRMLALLAAVLLLVVGLQIGLFGIAWPVAVLAVVLAYFLAIVAGRVAGETGIGMVGPMGKVAQLVVGGVSGTAVPNLMAANVAGGAASQCSDLLGDYKCGRILGATPRAQTIAQVWGAVVGAVAGTAAYMVLLPDPVADLAGEQWPAPAMRIWKSMAELLASGPEALPAGALIAVGYAAATAVLLVVIRGLVPAKVKPWMPSPSVLGLAFVVPAYMSVMLFVGGALAGLAGWLVPDFKRRLWVVICAGIVAGESILELGQALARALG